MVNTVWGLENRGRKTTYNVETMEKRTGEREEEKR